MSARRNQIAILTIGGIIFLGVLYYLVVFSPSAARERSLRERIGKKESDIAQMTQLRQEWQELETRHTKAIDQLKRRGKSFALLSFLEGLSRKVGISDRIQYMKPVSFPETISPMRQVGVELRLDGLSMEDLVRYLYQLEYSKKFLIVPRIKIQRMKGKGGEVMLRVTMQVNTYILQQSS
jgi:type II secretory pathway component PulM